MPTAKNNLPRYRPIDRKRDPAQEQSRTGCKQRSDMGLPRVILQSELGTALRESKIYTIQERQSNGALSDESIYTGSTRFLSLPETKALQQKYPKAFFSHDVRQERRLNSTEWLKSGLAFTFYGGDAQSETMENGAPRVKTFEELAGDLAIGEGFRRIGIGRMDVDDLSKLARTAQSSLSLNASFSSRLDLLLSGYVNTVRQNLPEAADFLNIVFSGGDDLMVVRPLGPVDCLYGRHAAGIHRIYAI
ncbi:MAG: hypothetical protein IPH12_07565 [Saprospirales bacterium]|nr:hypothetical protein [Saprospirales bacterium]